MPDEISGRYLNELWRVGVQHALYSHDGTWYHRLRNFPGALFDSQGYVVFSTEADFHQCPQLRIRQDVWCPSGISSIPGYVRVEALIPVDLAEPTQPERISQTVSRIIRDTAMSSAIKLLYEDVCQICGACIDLRTRTYSEAHHIRPLGAPHNGPDALGNLICVCPTCHVLLDYAAVSISLDGLQIVRHDISQDHVAYHNRLCEERAQP